MKTKRIERWAGVTVLAALLFIQGCSDDKPLKMSDIRLNILKSHEWKLNSLKVDGVDKTDLYQNMTLSIAFGSFTAANGAPVWPGSGTWSFSDTSGDEILRGDEVTVAVEEISEDILVLSLNWDHATYGDGRKASVSGHHVYTFIK